MLLDKISRSLRRLLRMPPPLRPTEIASAEAHYVQLVRIIASLCGSMHDKRILEAGCAITPDFLAEFDRAYQLREAVGVNLIIPQTRQWSKTMRVECGDLRALRFDNDYFDLIISSCVFEHVQNFDVALAEMYRVLKPSGFLFSRFGPIWSSSYGHHLWYWDGAESVTYHNLKVPAYCHLLGTEAELAQWLKAKGEAQADGIAKYVFRSHQQNQLMFSDYERAVARSPFKQVFLKGYDHPALQATYAQMMTAETLYALNERYPADRDKFLYDGITMLLQKPR